MSTAMKLVSICVFVMGPWPADSSTGSITNDGSESRQPLQSWQHAGENLEAEIFFVARPVGSSLEDANFVVEAFDKAERDLSGLKNPAANLRRVLKHHADFPL